MLKPNKNLLDISLRSLKYIHAHMQMTNKILAMCTTIFITGLFIWKMIVAEFSLIEYKLTIIIFHKKVNNVQAIPSRMKAPPISLSDTVMEGSFLFLRKNIRINATKKSLKYNICKSVYMAVFFYRHQSQYSNHQTNRLDTRIEHFQF